jgi:hypothetical protein
MTRSWSAARCTPRCRDVQKSNRCRCAAAPRARCTPTRPGAHSARVVSRASSRAHRWRKNSTTAAKSPLSNLVTPWKGTFVIVATSASAYSPLITLALTCFTVASRVLHVLQDDDNAHNERAAYGPPQHAGNDRSRRLRLHQPTRSSLAHLGRCKRQRGTVYLYRSERPALILLCSGRCRMGNEGLACIANRK